MASRIPARLLLFDVFGTVVDWRSSIAREVAGVAKSRGVQVHPEAFADRWRAGYRPAMDRVRKGELPCTNIDALHRIVLDAMLSEFGLAARAAGLLTAFVRRPLEHGPRPDCNLPRCRSFEYVAGDL